jgi:mannose-6-phosphate isomerase-like protein (cupin superfamily)
MFIENVYDTPRELIVAHEGQGSIEIARMFQTKKLAGAWHFIEYLVVPPRVTIGRHRHGENEEIYFIIEGQALMTLNGQEHEVKPGDFIVNPPHGEHGLRNESEVEVKLLVIEVDLKREA